MIPGSTTPLLAFKSAAAGQYQISRSLRFNSADSAYLSRTPASEGNRKTWTWSGWVKRSALVRGAFYGNVGATASNGAWWLFETSDKLYIEEYGGAYSFASDAVYRDTAAWLHLVVKCDTTQAVNTDRLKVYVNGAEVSASAVTYPSQNADTRINAAQDLAIGRAGIYNGVYFNGYLADIHFIDGQALTPSSFGETDATTGEWIPKAYTGTYGTNGFKLDFADNSAATAAALGKDTSGNGNNWTPTNLSVTAGTGNDSLVDTPTSYGTDTGVGGEVRGNYATLSPLSGAGTLANGNLDFSSSVGHCTRNSTIGVTSGKWYGEFTFASSSVGGIGITSRQNAYSAWPDNTAGNYWVYSDAGSRYIYPGGGTQQSQAGSLTAGTWQIALDLDNARCWVGYQGTWYNATWGTNGDPATGANPTFSSFPAATYFPFLETNSTAWSVNFGQRPFAYTAPSGFKALCDTNLTAPTIVKPSTVMDVSLYTGNGTSQTISGLGFSPDFVWIKGRSAATSNRLFDQVRGAGNVLFSDSTATEATDNTQLSAFTSTGFSVGSNAAVNTSAATYASWCWDAGSSTVTNTAGTIQSSVRANASAGFSVVTYTGTGANATVGHGLGVAPQMIIVKSRNDTYGWKVYHSSIGNGNSLVLNSTAASTSDSAAWNSTSPTSSVFSIGNGTTNASSSTTYVAYCFAPVAGYSAFGSYTGNGNADGPFVYCGFRPRWVMVKRTDTSGFDWTVYDSVRNAYNPTTLDLAPNLSRAEVANFNVDLVSAGIKLRTDSGYLNASTATYIYAVFAEAPFQFARAR